MWSPSEKEWIQMGWAQLSQGGRERIDREGISMQELLPIVLACMVWGAKWSGRAVQVHCDNTGAVAVVTSGYSRAPAIMHLLRCLFFIRAHFQISLWATHTPGADNTMADAISRNHLSQFFLQAPEARRHRVPIPQPLVDLLVEQQPDWTSRLWTRLFRSSLPRV